MFNRKKNLKPYYKDYISEDTGFKDYLVDSIKYMRKQNVVQAINFDLDALIAELPDKLEPGDIANGKYNISDKGKALIKQMMNEMGFQLFADMMSDMGLGEADIQRMIKGERESTDAPFGTPTGKSIPGFNDANTQVEANQYAEMIYEKTLEVLASIMDDALKINNPSMLQPIVNKMEEMIKEHGNKNPSATEVMTELMESTKVFIELVDDNKTTTEEYESFLNKLTNFFIEDEIDDTNADACKEHEGHDPKECDFIKKTKGSAPLQILYRRIHAMDGTDGNKCEAIPGLSLVIFDTVRAQIVPIAFSIHEAMQEKTGQNFQQACRSEEGTDFLLKTLVKYREIDEARFDEIVDARQLEVGGQEALAASIVVKPEVITPKAETMKTLLAEVRATFDTDAKEVFADINPEDFLK